MENYSILCRTCLSDNGNQISVFDTNLIDEDFLTYSYMINYCTNVEIKNEDLLPTKICKNCHTDIIQAFAFRQKCQKSDLFFKQLLTSFNIIKEEVNYNEETYNENYYELESTQIIDPNERVMYEIHTDENLIIPDINDPNHENVELIDKEYNTNFENIKPIEAVYPNITTVKSEQLQEECRLNNNNNDEANSNYCTKIPIVPIFREDATQTIKEEPPLIEEDDDYMDQDDNDNESDSNRSDDSESEFNNKANVNGSITAKSEVTFTSRPENTEEELLNDPKTFTRCKICKKVLRKKSMTVHKRMVHSKERPYECTICSKRFSYSYSLKVHIETHATDRGYKCMYCPEVFLTRHTLHYHMKEDHKDEPLFECSICGRKTREKNNLKLHWRRVHRREERFFCELCPKTFVFKCDLQVHVKREHEKIRKLPYTCELCGKKDFPNGIKEHFQTEHNLEFPFKCGVCHKEHMSHGRFKAHEDTHNPKRTYKCDICDKEFNARAHLSRHKKIHGGEKKFHCPHCPSKFLYNFNLKRHIKAMHPITDTDQPLQAQSTS